jgi:hypothetical protein
MVGILTREKLGMPLYAQDEAMVGALKAFNQSIFRCGIDHQALTNRPDGLMVRRVDL